MKYNVKSLFKIFKTAAKEWWSKDPFKESAVIAYYAIFSLPGLLVLILTVAGYLYGQDDINNKLSDQIASTMGQDTAVQVSEMIEKARATGSSVWATIIGIVTIIVGATGVFAQRGNTVSIPVAARLDGVHSVSRHSLFARQVRMRSTCPSVNMFRQSP